MSVVVDVLGDLPEVVEGIAGLGGSTASFDALELGVRFGLKVDDVGGGGQVLLVVGDDLGV